MTVRQTQKRRICKDCPPLLRPIRKAPYPGPRCTTHHRAKVKADKLRAHDKMIARTYNGMAEGDYARIWIAQGERCFICGRTGEYAKRMFPLEHDHETDWPRGITCPVCNDYIGWIKDNPDAARRLIDYLENPPAWSIIGPPPPDQV